MDYTYKFTCGDIYFVLLENPSLISKSYSEKTGLSLVGASDAIFEDNFPIERVIKMAIKSENPNEQMDFAYSEIKQILIEKGVLIAEEDISYPSPH